MRIKPIKRRIALKINEIKPMLYITLYVVRSQTFIVEKYSRESAPDENVRSRAITMVFMFNIGSKYGHRD